MHSRVLLCLMGCLFGLMRPGAAAGADLLPRPALEGAAGLERRVAYSETKIPLGELVARVAADTGVALTAAAEVADEPVAVVVKAIPARELLEQMADLLDYRWSRRGKEGAWQYEIWQDLASKQREEALRQAMYAAVERQFQEQLQLCRELSALPQEEMRKLWDAWQQRQEQFWKLTPEQQRTPVSSPEEKARATRLARAQQLWSPIVRSMAGFMTRLPPEQWAALRTGRQLVFASDPKPGELPLPADVLRTFRSSQPSEAPPNTAIYPGHPDVDEEIRRHEKEMQERWTGADGYHVTVRFTPDYPKRGWIVFNAISAPVRGGQRQGPIYGNQIFVINTDPQAVRPREPEDPQRRAALEQDPLLGAKKPFRPEARPSITLPTLVGPQKLHTLQDLLPDLAHTFGANCIADSYWTAPWIDALPAGGEPLALFALLGRFTGDGCTWDHRGTLIRVRSRNWFLDRPSEIPLRYVRYWLQQFDRLGGLPLDEVASTAAALSDGQLRSIEGNLRQGVFPPPLQDLKELYPARHLLRLYAALSPTQRQALRQGTPLPVAQIPPWQRLGLLATLNELARMRYPLMDLSQWASGSVSLTTEPQVRIREQRGGIVSYRLELVTPPAAGASRPAPQLGRQPAGAPAGTVLRFPVSRVKFQLRYGPDTPESVSLVVASPDAEGPRSTYRSSVVATSPEFLRGR